MSHVTDHCSESWRRDVEDVFALPTRILSQAQREFYFENGYFLLEGWSARIGYSG